MLVGGIGSGGVSRVTARATTGDAIAIDIRQLLRRGLLDPGHDVVLRRELAGRLISRIRLEVQDTCLVLQYVYSPATGESHPMQCGIPFASTPCNYGGARRWFRCLKCKRRVAVMYYFGGSCACRRCQDLAYPSQRKRSAPGDRARERAQIIRLRLGGSANLLEPFPPKPKWMRWRTYCRLKITALKEAASSFEELKVKFPGLTRP